MPATPERETVPVRGVNDSTCSGCGAAVRWVITEGGKRMPIDPDAVPDGNVVPVLVDGKHRARVLAGDQLPALGDAWRRHTCQPTTRTAPRCTVCKGSMDADLARREHWTTHPACDPTDAANAARAAITRPEAP